MPKSKETKMAESTKKVTPKATPKPGEVEVPGKKSKPSEVTTKAEPKPSQGTAKAKPKPSQVTAKAKPKPKPSEITSKAMPKPTEVTAKKSKSTEVTAKKSKPTEVTAKKSKPNEVTAKETKPTEITAKKSKPTEVTAKKSKPTKMIKKTKQTKIKFTRKIKVTTETKDSEELGQEEVEVEELQLGTNVKENENEVTDQEQANDLEPGKRKVSAEMLNLIRRTQVKIEVRDIKHEQAAAFTSKELMEAPMITADHTKEKYNMTGQPEVIGSELVEMPVAESKPAAEAAERKQKGIELVAIPEANLMKKLEVIGSEAKLVKPPLVKSKLSRTMAGEFKVGDVVLANTADSPLLYEAKVLEVRLSSDTNEWEYRIHYIGWKSRWDEFAPRARVLPNTWENKQLQVERNIQRKLELAKKPRGTPKGMGKSFGNDEVPVQSPDPRKLDPLIYLGAKKVKLVTLEVKGDAEPGNPLRTENNSAENTIVNNATTEPEKPTEDESSNVVVVAKKKKIRAQSAQPVAKKAKLESWKLILSGPLLKCLEEDRYSIEQENKLVKVPASVTVNKFLDEFGNTWSTSEDEILKCQVREFIAGLKMYFNSVLPFILLYRRERMQFEVLKGWIERPGPGPAKWSAVYAPVHLLRMLSKISDVMTETDLNKTTVTHLEHYFDYLISFFEKNLERFCYSSEAFVYTENKGCITGIVNSNL